MRIHGLFLTALATTTWLASSSLAQDAAGSRMPFPKPFVVERQLAEVDAAGHVTYQTPPVTDYYGESYLVSVREGEDRTILDFARREITEVQITKGTYWVLSFGRMRELRERLRRAETPRDVAARESKTRKAESGEKPAIKVEEVSDHSDRSSGRIGLAQGVAVRHFRAAAQGAPTVDLWVDGSVRLTKEGIAALHGFENEATGELGTGATRLADVMIAARTGSDGAIPVKTRRNVLSADGREDGVVLEETVSRLAALPAFPRKLLLLPETLKRIPSPLETMVAFAEEEAAIGARSR